MPELPEVTQGFEADVTAYLAAMDEIIAKTEEAAGAVRALEEAIAGLDLGAAEAALSMRAAANEATDLRTAIAGMAAATAPADAALGGLDGKLDDLIMLSAATVSELHDLRTAMAGVAVAAVAMGAATGAATAAAGATGRINDLRNSTLELAGADGIAADSMENLVRIARYLNTTFGIIGATEGVVLARSAELAAMNKSLADSFGNVRTSAATAAISESQLAAMNERLTASFGPLGLATRMDAEMAMKAAAANAALAASTAAVAASADRTAASGGVIANWLTQWGGAIHWIVMGTLEVAATAIPALVALGAAVGAMEPSFAHINDVMQSLYVSSGGLGGALRNSVGPLQQMGAAAASLQQKVAPDAYIIFGAAIEAVTSHIGAFSNIALQASNVLAQFATKIVTDLQGPAGAALSGFFANAVKYMIQWGQFLGNIGSTFLHVMSSMFGVGQILLTVLVAISRALSVISANPVIGFFIGLAAAMSAAYRYGKLLAGIWSFLGGSAAVQGISAIVSKMAQAVVLTGSWGAALTVVKNEMSLLLLNPVTLSIAGLAAGIGVIVALNDSWSHSTSNLIKQVQSEPQTISNLVGGIHTLEGALMTASQQTQTYSKQTAGYWKGAAANSGNLIQAKMNVQALTTAIEQQAQKLIALDVALAETGARTGQVGAAMNAMQISTGLADSKVQQMSQAIDQYIGLLTGGTSAVADFATSMSNIGTVAATGTKNLGTSTAQLSLNATQFAKALNTMNVTGAAAWQNLDQVISGSMAPIGDWMRQAQQLGAVTGPQFSRAMLDMAASVIPYVKGNTTAQNSLLGFMAAQGLTYPTFGKLASAAGSQSGAMKNLTGIIDGATNAMANLSQMAKNVSAALNSQVSGAIATAALNSTHFKSDLQGLQQAMANGSGPSVIHMWLDRINTDLQTAQSRGIAAGNGIASGMAHAGAGADQATVKVKTLQDTINGLHGKDISIGVYTTYYTSAVGAAPSGAVYTGKGPRAAGGYIDGPGTKTSDSIPIAASRGEFMMSAAAVDHYGRGLMEAMNARKMAAGGPVSGPGSPSPSVLSASGGGGGMTALTLNHNTTLKLDNTVVANQQRKEVLTYYRRNTGNNLALRTR